ncbi:MAG: STAS domain-containing protein [Planctomycetota bacterium]
MSERTRSGTQVSPIGHPASGPSAPGDAVPANRVEVARAGELVLVRIIGLGSMNNAGILWDFAVKAMEVGSCRLAFDLAECRGLDSTFLGTLVGLSQEADERAGADGWVCVFNVSDANRELFNIIGVDKYVHFRACTPMEPIETQPLVGGDASPEKRYEIVRRAHENLVGIHKRNEARFGAFLESLAAEMGRTRKRPD